MRKGIRKPPVRGFAGLVLDTSERRGLLAPEDVVLAAVSGGPDSTALVAALARLRDAGRIAGVRALHVDHGLRAGVEREGACAREACERLGVPFSTVRVEVGPGNLQSAARRARYRALGDAADRAGATRIATGHTRSDQAETFLLRALRGAGARGLSSIPPRRGRIVRPLIDRSREEVLAFLAGEGLRWCEDPTNASPRFARNALRRELVPVLRRLEPSFEAALARAADLLRDDERALSSRARRRLADLAKGALPLEALVGAPKAVRRRVVRELWRAARPGARALAAEHVDAILALVGRGRPGRRALPGGVEAVVARGMLAVAPRVPSPARRSPVG